MGWVSIALLLIRITYYAFKYGPQIANLIKMIADLIRGLGDDDAKFAYAGELDDAFKIFQKTKDNRPLLALLSKLAKRHCDGAQG